MAASDHYTFGRYKIDPKEVFYSTTLSYAMVNLRPLLPGHVLVCPKREVQRFADLTADETCDLWLAAQRVGHQLELYHKASSLTFAIQDGPQAGQTVPHVHIHVLPRKGGDFEKNDEIYDALDEKEKELKQHLAPVLHLPALPKSYAPQTSISFRFPSTKFSRRKSLSIRSVSVPAAPASEGIAPAISLTDTALKHLNKMRSERNEDLCLRIGVRQGGCSGMSYTMEFESRANARPDDSIIEYNGFVIVCDPKSLLFLFGMQLDYSDALIGGGFSFKNPNATQTCGCGKSFNAEM